MDGCATFAYIMLAKSVSHNSLWLQGNLGIVVHVPGEYKSTYYSRIENLVQIQAPASSL